MRQQLIRFVAAGALTLGACAAEVETRPNVYWETQPALVDVEPGVQVVGDADDEVFVSGGAYWVRRGDRWWTSPDHRGRWVVAEQHAVPERVRAYPVGRYRHYRR